jgi:hypothetical protein
VEKIVARKSLKGFMFLDDARVRNTFIISRVFDNRHFIILKYGKDVVEASHAFHKLNYKNDFGESWFMVVHDGLIASISFKLFSWLKYKTLLFGKGIDRKFRDECLKNRCASLELGKPVKLLFRTTPFDEDVNTELKSSLCMLLFNKKNIGDVEKYY